MNCPIDGVIIRELKRFDDQRGWLVELFRSDELDSDLMPAMSYVSMTSPGVVRGPHEHADQADLFCFIGPSMFRLYLWDNRAGSPVYRERFTYEFGDGCPASVIVPKGIVHAYKNIGQIDGIVYNAPNRLYAGEGRAEPVDEIRHEDKTESEFTLG